jgi:hypothetical protein
MLASSEYALIGTYWDTEERAEVNLIWHRVQGMPVVTVISNLIQVLVLTSV